MCDWKAASSVSESAKGWARVSVGGRESFQFEVKKGVRQGWPCGSLKIEYLTEARKSIYTAMYSQPQES